MIGSERTAGDTDERPDDPPGAQTVTPESTDGDPATTGDTPDQPAGRRPRTLLVVGGLTAIVTMPLAVALATLHSPRWYPLLDLAMTELRVRDVGTRHSPLVGLVGRLSSNGNQGSHPGPISFWALAPVHRLLGGSSWSLLVGVVVLNTTAVALTLWIAVRRGGAVLALGFAGALAVLLHLYGTKVLTEPWNPYMPVMWWVLTLVALWAVLCDDVPMLPVAVFAASFCMQTHISYLGLVGGFAALGLVGVGIRAYMLRGDRAARRRLATWSALSLAVGLVLWLPSLIDQVTGDPGNASIVFGHFREPDDDPIGLARGAELFAVHLNPWRLLAGQQATSGSVVPGLLLVGAWLAAAVVAFRLRARALVRLHAVVAIALVLGLISESRILGFIWYYLSLWAWGITTLMLVAIGWTIVAAVTDARPGALPVAARTGPALLAGVLAVWTVMFTVDAVDAEITQDRVSGIVADVLPPVLEAIQSGDAASSGPDARYRVTWTDGTYIGAPGFGLFNELERRGFDVGAAEPFGPSVVEHRVMPRAEADAEIHVSVGPDIEEWRAKDGFTEIAYVDPRTDAERAVFERARSDTIDQLERLGRDDLVPMVDLAPFMLYLDDSLPDETRRTVAPMGDLGQPLAVFVGPLDGPGT